MTRVRRGAAGLLVAGLVVALGTPGYVGLAAPHLAGYVMHPGTLLPQIIPYGVCAAIWLPWRARPAEIAGLIVAGLLFLTTLLLYIPILWAPATQGGDMVGLFYVLSSTAMAGGVLVASAGAAVVLWLRRRARRALPAPPPPERP